MDARERLLEGLRAKRQDYQAAIAKLEDDYNALLAEAIELFDTTDLPEPIVDGLPMIFDVGSQDYDMDLIEEWVADAALRET